MNNSNPVILTGTLLGGVLVGGGVMMVYWNMTWGSVTAMTITGGVDRDALLRKLFNVLGYVPAERWGLVQHLIDQFVVELMDVMEDQDEEFHDATDLSENHCVVGAITPLPTVVQVPLPITEQPVNPKPSPTKSEIAPPTKPTEVPPEYARFATMLKVGVPRGAVETKMKSEGLDPAILFPDSTTITPQPSTQPAKTNNVQKATSSPPVKLPPPPSKRVILRVTTISSDRIRQSMWNSSPTLQLPPPPTDLAQTFKQLFVPPKNLPSTTPRRCLTNTINDENKQPDEYPSSSIPVTKNATTTTTTTPTPLLPSRRSQNIAIGMAKFKLSPQRISQAILSMDASVFGREDDLQLLTRLLPTREEMDMFRTAVLTETAGDNNDHLYGEPERLFRRLARDAPDAIDRVEAMCFVSRFQSSRADVDARINRLHTMLTRIHASQLFTRVLLAIQQACVILNEDTTILSTGLSLMGLADRLTQTKTHNGDVCAADVVVALLTVSDPHAALSLKDDLGPDLDLLCLQTPTNLPVLKKEVTELKRGIERCSKLASGIIVPGTSPVAVFCSDGVANAQCEEVQSHMQQLDCVMNACLDRFGEDPSVVTIALFLQAVQALVMVIERSAKLKKVSVSSSTTIDLRKMR